MLMRPRVAACRAAALLSRHTPAALVAGAGAALAPSPLLLACACHCGGGQLPATVPDAPWQPLLVVAGAVAALLWRRRRGMRGSPPGGRRGGWRLALLLMRVMGVLMFTSVAVGVASAAVSAATPAATTAAPCDCAPDSTGTVQAIVPVPEAGAGGQMLRVAVPLLSGGLALVGGSILLRPRRRAPI